jgi:predicted nucleic acid-binding protein
VLIDTNVLLRRLEPRHPHFRDAVAGTERLIESGEAVHVTAQNIAEFWAAATRATTQNGAWARRRRSGSCGRSDRASLCAAA